MGVRDPQGFTSQTKTKPGRSYDCPPPGTSPQLAPQVTPQASQPAAWGFGCFLLVFPVSLLLHGSSARPSPAAPCWGMSDPDAERMLTHSRTGVDRDRSGESIGLSMW